MHDIRASYGWTDEEIIDQVEVWGFEWLLDSWKFIVEDRQQKYNFLMMVAPLARTPMDKKGGTSLRRYADKLRRMVEELTPWRKSDLRQDLKKRGVKPGELVVMLDAGDDPTQFEGSKMIRR